MFQVKDNAIGNLKYVGISRAVVVDNNDPLKRGRIRVLSPVLGETNWIPYLTTPGTFNVPDVDTVVYIQCDGGFYTHPVAWGNLNYGEDDDLQFPEEFQRVAPTNRGIYTPGGHLIEIDDGEDEAGSKKGIRITTSDNTVINIADEPTDHSVTVTFDDGLEIVASGTEDKLIIDTNNGEHIELSKAEGFQLSTPDNGGTSASFKGGKIDIVADSDITVTSTNGSLTLEANGDVSITSDTGTYSLTSDGDMSFESTSGNYSVTASAGDVTLEGSGGAKLKLSGGQVGLGTDSAEVLDIIDQLIDLVDQTETGIEAITVPTAVGPSGPPINSATFIGIQSSLATLKSLLGTIKGGV
jgi:hypothetical protein